MSTLIFDNQLTPATPSTGTTAIFVDSGNGHTSQIDDTGTVIDLAAGGGSGVSFGGSATAFTPTFVQYIDNGGLQYGDALFTRDSVTNETNILRTFASANITSVSDTLGDGNFSGVFTGIVPTTYTITCDGNGVPDTFSWTDGTNSGAFVPMSNSPTLLSNGLSVDFGNLTGHIIGNSHVVIYTPLTATSGFASSNTFGPPASFSFIGNGTDSALAGVYDGTIFGQSGYGAVLNSDSGSVSVGINAQIEHAQMRWGDASVTAEVEIKVDGAHLLYDDGVGGQTQGIQAQGGGITMIGNIRTGGNGTLATINDVLKTYKMQGSVNGGIGATIFADYGNDVVGIGDMDFLTADFTAIRVFYGADTIEFTNDAHNSLRFDGVLHTFSFGDVDGMHNRTRVVVDDGNLGINLFATHFNLSALTNYANNAAAVTGGLNVGDLYYTNVAGDGVVKIVV
jgi:hypothetical protein